MTKHIIAYVRLTDGTVEMRQTDAALLRCWLGGRGLGMHLLESAADQHPLIFLTGPLTDAPVPPGGRYCAVTRSDDSGQPICLSSGTGWGAALKKAGLDGIVIEGEAPEWVCLSIKNGTVRLLPAQPYVGMLTGETSKALKSAFGQNTTALCIGPAGENLVPLAAVLCDTERAFSRGGIGKIMGAKKLKAIVADSAGDIPANACSRCTVACRHNAAPKDPAFSACCNAYGLDCVGAAQAMDAIGAFQRRGLTNITDQGIPEISCPQTPLARLAGFGAEAVLRAYGTEPVPPAPKRSKQNLPAEMAAVVDSLGCCLFAAAAFRPEDYAGMLTEAVGEDFSPEELMRAGAQILQLEQRIQPSESTR